MLQKATETMHHCKASMFAPSWVIGFFGGEVAWDGVVDTFHIEGRPKAKRCYAWSFVENGEPKYTMVLEIPPVDSAKTAVKVAIAAKARK